MRSYFQNIRIQLCRAEHRSFSRLSAVPVLLVMLATWVPQHAAATTDTQFQQYITDLCLGNITAPPGVVWDTATLSTMCTNAASGFVGQAGATVSANLGTANASSGTASRKKKGVRERLEELEEEPEKAASADGGGWGILVAPQYGKSKRPETELENGFQSELKGLLIGLDYRFSDSFVLGAAIGQTKDDAAFLNSAGSLKSSNNTVTVYGTWLPSENVSVDGYIGYGKINFDSQRLIVFGTAISGTASGSTSGSQTMAGVSAAYQTTMGRVGVAPFANLDYIKTDISGYNENSNDPLADTMSLHYGDRSTISSTSSIGARANTSYGYEWGSLVPSVRLAAVHEFQNNASQINNELVSAPGSGFLVATDSPDRNYFTAGLGVIAALNGGTQLFLDYEKRNQDKLLDSWSVSFGVLVEY